VDCQGGEGEGTVEGEFLFLTPLKEWRGKERLWAPSFQDVLLSVLTGGLVATPNLDVPLPSSLRDAPPLRTALAPTISDLGP